MITYDDFQQLELKIGTVREARRIENSNKLIKLEVALGKESCQIIAGIGKNYEPKSLINKQIVVLTNLEPKKLMGIESHGMLLAASSENGPILLIPETETQPGTSIK
jgi:methionine--tRNA ligase beta chain